MAGSPQEWKGGGKAAGGGGSRRAAGGTACGDSGGCGPDWTGQPELWRGGIGCPNL